MNERREQREKTREERKRLCKLKEFLIRLAILFIRNSGELTHYKRTTRVFCLFCFWLQKEKEKTTKHKQGQKEKRQTKAS